VQNRYPTPTHRTDDPAFQPPYDPTRGNIRGRASVISRDAPIVTVEVGWTPESLRAAIVEHIHGIFVNSTQVVDSIILTDSRVQSALTAREGGLLGRPLSFGLPRRYRKSPLAKECRDAWVNHWPAMSPEATFSELLKYRILLGFAQAQNVWRSSKYMLPHISMWNSRHTYWDYSLRRYINVTLDGQEVVDKGDAHHILYCPHGEYRGWMRGKAFSIVNWWLARQYALRDANRFSEARGLATLLAISPMGADIDDIANFRAALENMGQENVIQLPQSADPSIGKYAVEFLEQKSTTYEIFHTIIELANAEICLAILGQNLGGGQEVKEGSFAAARVHADVRQQLLQQDATSLAWCIYEQVARPFAALNFGNPDLAPFCTWRVEPEEDEATRSKVSMTLAMALNYLRLAGYRVKNPRKFARGFGVDFGDIEHVDPIQVEARLAAATGEADENAEAAQ
jgi:hypothetical protein